MSQRLPTGTAKQLVKILERRQEFLSIEIS